MGISNPDKIVKTDVVLKSGSTSILFDAMLTMSTSATSRVPTHPVESGAEIADNIVNENITVSMRGIITAIAHKIPDSPLASKEDGTSQIPYETLAPPAFNRQLLGAVGFLNEQAGRVAAGVTTIGSLINRSAGPQTVTTVAQIKYSRGGAGSLSPAEAQRRLYEMRDSRQLMEIVTPLGIYRDLALVSITEPRDVSHGGDLSGDVASWEVDLEFTQIRVRRSGTSTVPITPELENKPKEENDTANATQIETTDPVSGLISKERVESIVVNNSVPGSIGEPFFTPRAGQ